MAAGASGRDTLIISVELESGDFFLITSLSNRTDTQVISIDPTTGALRFTNQPEVDVFQSEAEAGRCITEASRWSVKNKVYGRAILGYGVFGSSGLLLIATKVRASIPDMPGGDTVYTVMESQWVRIPLRNPQPQTKTEVKNVSDLADIAIDGLHFFCETKDITRPFPSEFPVDDPDLEFSWNTWLSAPFRDIGLGRHCVVLLQGLADARTFCDAKGQYVSVALTARRSRLHPGTRYLARGLNAAYSTGNEAECEQLVWPAGIPTGKPTPFSTYLWRRGTIPIWWGAEIKSTVSEAEIYIAESDTYKGSSHYFKRLTHRYSRRGATDHRTSNSSSATVPIVCVNLLRGAVGKSELPLLQHFQNCVNQLNSNRGELPNSRVILLNYDWHANIKLVGDARTVDGLWELIHEQVIEIGFQLGAHYPAPNPGVAAGSWKMSRRQKGVMRFNCADSLDRTNAASFFGALQVLSEQCRSLGVSLDSERFTQPLQSSRASQAPLPPGWERRKDAVTGQVFYIDHNTRSTTWDHPCPDESWKRFAMSAEEFKLSTLPLPVSMMAELFLLAGDVHAMLYTGSKAMHSHILQIFGDDAARAKRSGAAQNVAITLQRRYLNVLVDNTRQKQLEMFLGMHRYQHFPTLPERPVQIMSGGRGFLLKPIASAFPSLFTPDSLINVKFKDMIWVCPGAAEVVQLFIFLSEPCHVAQLLVTVQHGVDERSSPVSFDVRTGRHIDGMKLVLEGANIPRCGAGTQLLYSLPGAISPEDAAITGAGHFPWLYDFEEPEGEVDFLTRFVAITFYGEPGVPLTLGEVEVLGISLFWNGIWNQRLAGASKLEQDPLDPLDPLPESSKSGPVFDLLTGDLITSPAPAPAPAPQPRKSIAAQRSQSRLSGSMDLKDIAAERYREQLNKTSGGDLGKSFSFAEAMELEFVRLQLGLSAAERDRVLLDSGKDPATLNPNKLLNPLNLTMVRQAAVQLATLNQVLDEDEELRSIGLPPDQKPGEVLRNQSCSHSECEVVMMRKGSMIQGANTVATISICNSCGRKMCGACVSGKGTALIGNLSQAILGGSASSGVARGRAALDSALCKQCIQPVVQEALLLAGLRKVLYKHKKLRFEAAVLKAFQDSRLIEAPAPFNLRSLLKGESSLAEFPESTLLYSVACDRGSESATSLLGSTGPSSSLTYWKAPIGAPSVELGIVLGQPSLVSGIILLVSPCGYTGNDVPTVEAWCGNFVSETDRVFVGKWDFGSAGGTPQQQLMGPERDSSNPRHLVFRLRSPVKCRIVWIKLSLAGSVGRALNAPTLNQAFDLLSFDPVQQPQNGRLNRFGSTQIGGGGGGVARIHARRIIITGEKLLSDFDQPLAVQAPEKLAWKNMLETPARFGRLRVQIDSERLDEGGRVVEQMVSQTAPNVAGFRLDAPLALRNIAKQSRISNQARSLDAAFDSIDEFLITPAVLNIRVLALQERYVPVANYVLPVARAGTPLYFDFPRPIEARALCFQLTGNLSVYMDEEGGEAEQKEVPFPSSLSLANKIRLYRYALTTELGKWPQLYAV